MNGRSSLHAACGFAALLCGLGALVSLRAQDPDDAVGKQTLVVVNGNPITEGDLQFAMLTHGVPKNGQAKFRRSLLEQLVDRRLIEEFLASRDTTAAEAEIDAQVERIHRLIRQAGDDPAKVLNRLGLTEQALRKALSLPLAWNRHVRNVVTDEKLQTYFAEHRVEFNGTQVRASQIFLKLGAEADENAVEQAEAKLLQLRGQIVDGQVEFSAAARRHSEAPSRENGGDVGFFPYRGKMPPALSQVAFGLKVGEVSKPFRTPFGVHLITVTERKPGDLSLEDVRPAVFKQLSQEMWDKTVRAERENAKIEWRTSSDE